jgi:hypothetical protein
MKRKQGRGSKEEEARKRKQGRGSKEEVLISLRAYMTTEARPNIDRLAFAPAVYPQRFIFLSSSPCFLLLISQPLERKHPVLAKSERLTLFGRTTTLPRIPESTLLNASLVGTRTVIGCPEAIISMVLGLFLRKKAKSLSSESCDI